MIPPGPNPPGSFTKNFAWHGKGMSALHSAVRQGFSGKLTAVEREAFYAACGLSRERFLIAANFFLFNTVAAQKNIIPVDEFVHQAVVAPHSAAFDRLGLFVLNLSLGGKRRGANGVEYPAPWANAFVRQVLWQSGRWQSAALSEATMDAFIGGQITGEDESKDKCRTNYRHIFEQTKYLPAAGPQIDTGSAAWIAAALFTAWDRRGLAAGGKEHTATPDNLVAASEVEDDYKLLGLTLDEFRSMAPPIADQYVSAGGLQRFTAPPPAAPKPKTLSAPKAGAAPPSPPPPTPIPASLNEILEAGSDAAVDRVLSKRFAQKRNQVLAARMKAAYKYSCMVCGGTTIIGLDPHRLYAEAAHIKPLGQPHNGPDKAGNLLVLCPPHHLQFDYGVLSVEKSGAGVRFVSRIPGDPVHRKSITLLPGHTLDLACVKWHADTFANVGK